MTGTIRRADPPALARGSARRWRRSGGARRRCRRTASRLLWLSGGALAIAVAHDRRRCSRSCSRAGEHVLAARGPALRDAGGPRSWARSSARSAPRVPRRFRRSALAAGDAARMSAPATTTSPGSTSSGSRTPRSRASTRPEWALVIERLQRGAASTASRASSHRRPRRRSERRRPDPRGFEREHARALGHLEERSDLEHDEIGAVNAALERARLALRAVELEHGVARPTRRESVELAAARGELAAPTTSCASASRP